MNTQQPEALRLAAHLWDFASEANDEFDVTCVLEAIAELRRLHSVNAELLEALQQMQLALSRCFGPHKAEEGDRHRALAASRAAIAKAQG
jgi:hypothetical protein